MMPGLKKSKLNLEAEQNGQQAYGSSRGATEMHSSGGRIYRLLVIYFPNLAERRAESTLDVRWGILSLHPETECEEGKILPFQKI